MEEMRDSTTQIVKIVRMVFKFHPLLTVANFIFQVMFLQGWIEEKISNQWKALKVYCRAIMTALLDLFIKKMKNLSKALQMHLDKEVKKGYVKTRLIGKLAIFSATFLLLETEFSLKYDKRGVKTQYLLITGLCLLTPLQHQSQLGIRRGKYSCIANSTSNSTFFFLALLFAKFFDNSLMSLGSTLCMAVFFLCLLVIIRPQTDFGLFGFIIGVSGSITYNYFGFKFPTWIITSICFVLFGLKSWLDKHWLDLKEGQLLASTNATVGSNSTISLPRSLPIMGAFCCYIVKSSVFDYKVLLVKLISTVFWSSRLFKRSLHPANTTQITGLILTVVNVAQGMFEFALSIGPEANYKEWLFVGICFVVFCSWLHSIFPQDLSLPSSTNTKGITSMILSLQSMAKYSILVLLGFEPCLYRRDWLVVLIFYVLWWIRAGMSFPKQLFLDTTVDFKAPQLWTIVVCALVSDYVWYLFDQAV